MTEPPTGSRQLRLLSSLPRLLRRCRSLKQLHQIHSHLITSTHLSPPHGDHCGGSGGGGGFSSLLLSRLLFFCALSPSGSLHYAAALFRTIPDPDLFAYNVMIRASATSVSSPHGPLSLYTQMLLRGVRPDHLTFPFLLRHCTSRRDPFMGGAVHAHVVRFGFRGDPFVGNNMISMYAACGFPHLARQVFEEMSDRDVVSWNSILIGYLRCGELDLALALFLDMEKKRNVVTWNSIITGFVQGGRARKALDLFHEMLRSGDGCVVPDKITIASVISACADLGALDHGRWVHGYLKSHKLEFDVVVGTALVDMYGKCGCLETAAEVFEELPRKDVLAWTAMISAFAVNGRGEEAFRILSDMEKYGVRPNQVTFVAILSACAHSGMVKEGQRCFHVMRHAYSIEPSAQHYACMVDLLGRAGLCEEAIGLIRRMPMEPDVFVWGALLGACQMHGEVELGEQIASYLIRLDPFNHAFYVILSDLYARANRFDDAKKVWTSMKVKGIKKISPGCSMIEVDGQVYEFSIKGSPDIAMEKIIPLLNGMKDQLNFVNHVFNVMDFPETS